jgi:hypothetical protein
MGVVEKNIVYFGTGEWIHGVSEVSRQVGFLFNQKCQA